MNRRKKLVVLLLVTVLCMMSVIPVYAASNSQNGVTVSVSTDRQQYSQNDIINISVDVHNANTFSIEGVTVETHTPSGYRFAGDVGTKYLGTLGASESYQMSVPGNVMNLTNAYSGGVAQTGDHNGAFLWCVLLVLALSGAVTLGIVYRKNRKGMLSLLLCMMMVAGMLPVNGLHLSAANSNPVQTVSAYETIEVEGKQIEVGASVSFQFPGSDDEQESDIAEPVVPDSLEGAGNEGSTPPSGSEGSETPGGNEGSETPGGNEGSETPGGNEGNETPGENGGGETPGASQPVNILTGNTGFENNVYNWSTSMLKTWSATQSKAYSRAGEASLLLSVSQSAAPDTDVTMAYSGSRENLKPNTEYVMLAWVKTESGKPLQNTTEGATTNGIRVYLKSADALKTSNEGPYVADTNGKWQKIYVPFTTKADVENPAMTAYIKIAKGTYGNVYVDDVAIYEKAEVDWSAPETEDGYTNPDTGGESNAPGNDNEGSETPDDNEGGETPDTNQPMNILTGNVGFETGTGNWNKDLLGTWTTTQNKQYSRNGEASLLLSVSQDTAPTTDVTMAYNGARESLEPDTEYVMLAWIRTEEGKPLQNTTDGARTGIRVYLRSTDAEKTSNEGAYVADTEGMWQRIYVPFKTKAEVANPSMTAYLKIAAGTYGSVYVDDVAIYKKADIDLTTPEREEDKGDMTAGAYPDNILTGNTGFENSVHNWSTSMLKTWSATQSKAYSRAGNASLLLSVSQSAAPDTDVTMAYSGSRENLKPNTEYVMMAWVKTESGKPLQNTTEGATTNGIRVYLKSADALKTSNEGPYVADTDGKWQRIYVPFTTKADVENPAMTAYLKIAKGTYGNVYVDDVAIYEKAEVDWSAPETEDGYTNPNGGSGNNTPGNDNEGGGNITEDLVPIGENLFVNGSFEEFNPDGTLVGRWVDHSGGNWAETSKIQVVDGGYNSTKSVRIKTDDGSNPCFYQADTNVIGGEEYFVTCMVKTTEMLGTGPRIKIEYYDAEGHNFESSQSEYFGNTNGEWKKKGLTFKAPTGTTSVKVYMRLYGAGEVYYDDLQLYKYGEAEKLYFEGDTFFYTEWLNGTVGIRLNTDALELTGTEVVDISLKDPETNTVLGTPVTGVPAATIEGETVSALKPNYTFDVSLLVNKGQKYVIEATLYDAAGGNALGTSVWPIYRYDRPTMIKESGEIVDPNTGETIIPVWGYHVYNNTEMQQAAKAAGINIIQGSGSTKATALQYLDLAQQNGLYATVLLYSGMKAAGSEGQIENTKEIVEAVKDHPALFGYLVMDEPYLHMSEPYDDLVNSYKIIRDLDPVHPVIIQDVESTGSTKYTTATSDILVLHHYACNVTMMPNKTRYGMMGTTRVINRMLEDLDPNTSLTRRKVVHYLGQSFGVADKSTAERYYLPTIDEAKSMIYQALMTDMEGIGYYSFTESGWKVTETDLYPGLVSFAEKELPIIKDAYIGDRYRDTDQKKYTMLNEDRKESSEVWWETFKDADGNWYVITLNMTEENKTVTVPLVSADNTMAIDKYAKELVGGTGTATVEEESGTLTVALGAHGTAMYKLTPVSTSIYDSLTKLNEETAGDVLWGLYKDENGNWYVKAENKITDAKEIEIALIGSSDGVSRESMLKYTAERIGGSEEVTVTNKLGYFSVTIPAQATAEYKLTPVVLNNMLLSGNVGFENGNKTGWQVTQSAYKDAVTISNADSRTGKYCLVWEVTEDVAEHTGLTVEYKVTNGIDTLKPNTKYTMQMWVRTDSGAPLQLKSSFAVTGVRAYVKGNSTSNFVKQTNEGTCIADTTGKWQLATVTFETKNVTNASIQVYLKMANYSYGKVYIDDVAIYESATLN